MREQTFRVNQSKLISLSEVYRASKVAESLDISRQRWNSYKNGKRDMPESIVNRLCEKYNLNKNELVLSP